MFTIDQIHAAHAGVKSGADFPGYIQELKELGLKNYIHYVVDGHTDYQGTDNMSVIGPAKYSAQPVKAQPSPETLKKIIKEHQEGKTSYIIFCSQAAAAGVEKWIVNLEAMTCTYYDIDGNTMIVEPIPDA